MRAFYISEMDSRAAELAEKMGGNTGVEIIDFCRPENLENEAAVRAKGRNLANISILSLHAPYYEMFPSAIDPLVRSAAVRRFTQALEVCRKLGADRMVVHSGYTSQIYFPQWFMPKSIEFWRAFAEKLPDNFLLLIENVLDDTPEYLCEICDGVNDARVKLCLDTGHVNAYSHTPVEAWIRSLGSRIAHVHLHNNSGAGDEHAPLGAGSMDMTAVLAALNRYAPEAAICIESMDAKASLKWLMERGYIDVRPL